MIRTLTGDQFLQGDLGTLVAVNVAMMAKSIEKLSRGNKNVEYGVPFFDDLDFYPKTIAFHDVVISLFDRKMPPLPENAWYASTLTAICRNIEETVVAEIKMKHWSKMKFDEENRFIRILVRNAFLSLYPKHPLNLAVDWNDATMFALMAKRLVNELKPEQYFLLAAVEKEKRETLIKRIGIPNDYFEMPFDIKPMTKVAMGQECETFMLRVFDMTMPFLFCKSTVV
ncbi:MAG: hypothetical protein ACRC2T_14840 [Thermoguttaceae bacterium]